MDPRRLVPAALAMLLLGLGAPGREAAGDPLDARKISELRVRAKAWIDARTESVIRCPTCEGRGTIRSVRTGVSGAGGIEADCPYCTDGRKVSPERVRNSYAQFLTPAARQHVQGSRTIELALRSVQENPALILKERLIIDAVTPEGSSYAVVRLRDARENGGDPIDLRWILLSPPSGTAAKWYLWTQGADPTWGLEVRTGEPAGPAPSVPPAPGPDKPSSGKSENAGASLSAEEQGALESQLQIHKVNCRLRGAALRGSLLAIRLLCVGVDSEEALVQTIEANIAPAMRAAMASVPRATEVRLDFLACYRDRLGQVAARAYESASMARDLFQRVHFENLEPDEVLALFTREPMRYPEPGLKLWWRGECADATGDAEPKPTPKRPASSPDPKPPGPIAEALRWLVAHQSPDGGWESEGFPRWCSGKQVSDGPAGKGRAQYDVGVTGLATLALLRAGYAPGAETAMSRAVGGGLYYLIKVQDEEGCFGPRATSHYVYNHGAAALAMVEAYAATRSVEFLRPARRGLEFSALARNPTGGWRYGVQPGDSDTSVTGWIAQALLRARELNRSEKQAGRGTPFPIDGGVFNGVLAWVERMTDPDSGRMGYQRRGSGSARTPEMVDAFPADQSESMTAVGVFLRLALDENAATSSPVELGTALLAQLPPSWNPDSGSIDMYYWYYGTAAMRAVGGELWQQWRGAFLAAAKTAQRTDTEYCGYKGSFDNLDPWGPDGGRVYSTAMMALTLIHCEL